MSGSGSTATTPDVGARYGSVAQALHLIIAVLIISQLALGWSMAGLEAPKSGPFERWHVSIGITVLLLTIVRIVWAVTQPRPELPQGLPCWERHLALASHALFYVLLLALPLTGWFMGSIGARPLQFWGGFFPHFPAMPGLLEGHDKMAIRGTLEWTHGTPLVWTTVALIVLHLVGVIKHEFDGHPVIWRMIPGVPRP